MVAIVSDLLVARPVRTHAVTRTSGKGVMSINGITPPPPPPPPPTTIPPKDWGITQPVGGGWNPTIGIGYKVGNFNWKIHIDKNGVPTVVSKITPWPKAGG